MIGRSTRKTTYIKLFQSLSFLAISWPILGVFFVPALLSGVGIALLLGGCGLAALASARIQQTPQHQWSAFFAGLLVAAAGALIGITAVLTIGMFIAPIMMLTSMFTIPMMTLSNSINFIVPNFMLPFVTGATMLAATFSFMLGGLAAAGVGALLFHFGLNPFIGVIAESIEKNEVSLLNDESLQNNNGNTQVIFAGLDVQPANNSHLQQDFANDGVNHGTPLLDSSNNISSARSSLAFLRTNPHRVHATTDTTQDHVAASGYQHSPS